MSPYYIMCIHSRDDYRLLLFAGAFFAVVRFLAGAAFLAVLRLAAVLVVVRLREAVVFFRTGVLAFAFVRLLDLVAFFVRLVLPLRTVLPRFDFVVLRTTVFLTVGTSVLTATTARFVSNTSAL